MSAFSRNCDAIAMRNWLRDYLTKHFGVTFKSPKERECTKEELNANTY